MFSIYYPNWSKNIIVRGIGRGIMQKTLRTENVIIHVGFGEIMYCKVYCKVEELVIIHLHLTPHLPSNVIVGNVVKVGSNKEGIESSVDTE